MEVITIEYLKEYIESKEMQYISTQSKLCIPIIKRLCQKMSHGIKFDDIKICDNLIVDGHHRYLSSLIAGVEIGFVLSHKTAATKVINWLDVEFVENDWDTESKILHLNELDALYNGLDIEFLKQITSE